MNAIEWTAEQMRLTSGKTLADRLEVIAERQLSKHGYVTSGMVAREINSTTDYVGGKWGAVVRSLGLRKEGEIKPERGGRPVGRYVK